MAEICNLFIAFKVLNSEVNLTHISLHLGWVMNLIAVKKYMVMKTVSHLPRFCSRYPDSVPRCFQRISNSNLKLLHS